MGHVGPLGKNLNFLSFLGSLKFQDCLSFLFILKLSYSNPFHNSLNYASTANMEEVMKIYNLGDKTFETDFRWTCEVNTMVENTQRIANSFRPFWVSSENVVAMATRKGLFV